jgi:hypothetical protein
MGARRAVPSGRGLVSATDGQADEQAEDSRGRIGAIKQALRRPGFDVTNKTLYDQDLATRLKVKQSFRSLSDLTRRDLEDV